MNPQHIANLFLLTMGCFIGSFGYMVAFPPDTTGRFNYYNESHIPVEVDERINTLPCETFHRCKLLAQSIYYEARGESEMGQQSVAYVIMNRVKSPFFPDTIEGVIKQRCHFSYRCDGSMNKGVTETKAWKKALKVAGDVFHARVEDPTGGADHYVNKKKLTFTPRWTKVYPEVATIGNHTFYRRD